METGYFERDEGRLAYSDYGGQGPIVLMLPGMGALRSEYRYLAPKLAEAGYRAVAMDLRGQGESAVSWNAYDVPSVGMDILALIEHLGDRPSHLIGTSFAAAPVVWAAAERPDKVRSIVLISPFVRVVRISPGKAMLFWFLTHNPWRIRAWAAYYRTLYPTHKPPDFGSYMRALRANLAEQGRFDAVLALGNSSRRPAAERLSRVKSPALVIMGTKDRDFPDPAAEGAIVADQVHGSVELVEGAGHYPQTESPDRTASLIIGFLNRNRQGVPGTVKEAPRPSG
jgi:pimeloyl-ACP methyl ester carboxylesterase